jgi:IstB-like ATP binding protein
MLTRTVLTPRAAPDRKTSPRRPPPQTHCPLQPLQPQGSPPPHARAPACGTFAYQPLRHMARTGRDHGPLVSRDAISGPGVYKAWSPGVRSGLCGMSGGWVPAGFRLRWTAGHTGVWLLVHHDSRPGNRTGRAAVAGPAMPGHVQPRAHKPELTGHRPCEAVTGTGARSAGATATSHRRAAGPPGRRAAGPPGASYQFLTRITGRSGRKIAKTDRESVLGRAASRSDRPRPDAPDLAGEEPGCTGRQGCEAAGRASDRADLVLIDEVGLASLDDTGACSCPASPRRIRGALGIFSHWPSDQWGRFLPEHITAVSLLDRLLHHAVVVSPKESRSACARPGPRQVPSQPSKLGSSTEERGLFLAISGGHARTGPLTLCPSPHHRRPYRPLPPRYTLDPRRRNGISGAGAPPDGERLSRAAAHDLPDISSA